MKRAILLSLDACSGQPMPESALLSAAELMTRHLRPTRGDVEDALKDCEAGQFVVGTTDAFTGERNFVLTQPKGVLQARQLK